MGYYNCAFIKLKINEKEDEDLMKKVMKSLTLTPLEHDVGIYEADGPKWSLSPEDKVLVFRNGEIFAPVISLETLYYYFKLVNEMIGNTSIYIVFAEGNTGCDIYSGNEKTIEMPGCKNYFNSYDYSVGYRCTNRTEITYQIACDENDYSWAKQIDFQKIIKEAKRQKYDDVVEWLEKIKTKAEYQNKLQNYQTKKILDYHCDILEGKRRSITYSVKVKFADGKTGWYLGDGEINDIVKVSGAKAEQLGIITQVDDVHIKKGKGKSGTIKKILGNVEPFEKKDVEKVWKSRKGDDKTRWLLKIGFSGEIKKAQFMEAVYCRWIECALNVEWDEFIKGYVQ